MSPSAARSKRQNEATSSNAIKGESNLEILKVIIQYCLTSLLICLQARDIAKRSITGSKSKIRFQTSGTRQLETVNTWNEREANKSKVNDPLSR